MANPQLGSGAGRMRRFQSGARAELMWSSRGARSGAHVELGRSSCGACMRSSCVALERCSCGALHLAQAEPK
eukprot:4712001-Alexandrium_andersonii.AAC.1